MNFAPFDCGHETAVADAAAAFVLAGFATFVAAAFVFVFVLVVLDFAFFATSMTGAAAAAASLLVTLLSATRRDDQLIMQWLLSVLMAYHECALLEESTRCL